MLIQLPDFYREGFLLKKVKISKLGVRHELFKSSLIARGIKEFRNIIIFSLFLILTVTSINFFDIKLIKNAYASTLTYIDEGFKDIRDWQDYRIKLNFLNRYTNDQKISRLILKYSKQYQIDDLLLLSLIKTESSLNPLAVNYNLNGTIDRGLCQLNSSTFSYLDKSILFDPDSNIKYGAQLLNWCLKKSDNNIVKALAFYNAGIGNVSNKKIGETTLDYINKIILEKSKLDKEYFEYINSVTKIFY